MEALHLIYTRRGIITIEELLKKIPVTERQLERKFKEHIGDSPKRFSDIIKFQKFLKLLRSHPSDQKISDAVYDGGYYDQAHLNNYFKKITGVTPVKYKLHQHLLAINFMQLSANV
jgi:methylphosphotriester-DNA--protein-cysteine methyltransferase